MLLECGCPEDKAEFAKRIFIQLKQSQDEDMRGRLIKIASQLSNQIPSNGSDVDRMEQVKLNVASGHNNSSPKSMKFVECNSQRA